MLVHVCCAPDALYVLGLLQADYDLTAYFYNPNIHPHEEYDLRLEETRKIARLLDVNLIEGEYDDRLWFDITQKFKTGKDSPESL